MRTVCLIAAVLIWGTVELAAQVVEVPDEGVQIRLVDTELGAAIQAIGRYLGKPVIATGLGDARVEFFETPQPVQPAALAELLMALVEAQGLEYVEEPSVIRIGPATAAEQGTPARADGGSSSGEAPIYELFAVRLKHARASDVAATLNQLFGSGVDFGRPAGLSQGTLADALRAPDPEAAAGDPEQPVGASLQTAVSIVPDELTNTLLIRASERDYTVLEQAVQELDVRPLQVLIEVVVVEARRDRQFAMGFGVDVPPQPLEGGTIEGSTLGGGLGDLVVQVMGLGRYQVNAALTAARSRGDVEILSRPILLASNNTEASLLVGTQQPFVQVSRSLPTDTPQRDQVVQYRDVGTKLSVLPTINEDGYVSLLVQQEISAATGEMQFSAPVISSREAVTQVLVADGQTVVIGGLRDHIQDEVKSGVPLLVDIPLIGGIFGSSSMRSVETELFLFITPTVLRDDIDAAAATEERWPEGLGPMAPDSLSLPDSLPPPDSIGPGGSI